MKPLDIFCKNCRYEDIVQEVFSVFGKSKDTIKQTEDGSYNFFSNDIEFLIHGNHEIEDDMGIAFSDYPIQISLIKIGRAHV